MNKYLSGFVSELVSVLRLLIGQDCSCNLTISFYESWHAGDGSFFKNERALTGHGWSWPVVISRLGVVSSQPPRRCRNWWGKGSWTVECSPPPCPQKKAANIKKQARALRSCMSHLGWGRGAYGSLQPDFLSGSPSPHSSWEQVAFRALRTFLDLRFCRLRFGAGQGAISSLSPD